MRSPAARSGSTKRSKLGSSDASYTSRVSRGSAPRRPWEVPLVRNTLQVRSAGKERSASSLKAPVGTAGISCHVRSVRGVRPRPSQKRA